MVNPHAPRADSPKGISRRKFLTGAGLVTGGLLIGQTFPTHSAGAQMPFGGTAPVLALGAQQQPKKPLLLAHFMPWYQSPAVSGYWGWHWTMDHFKPTHKDDHGRPQIASHYLPRTGPYDSSDPHILEYQTILMKLSGIDGVIVDWYGISSFRDYGVLHKATLALFEATQKAGLIFAVCYEDSTVKEMVKNGYLNADEALKHGQEVVRFMDQHWFHDPSYLKHEDQPLVFTFGPQYFKSASDWESMFSVATPSPALITLDGHLVAGALGTYPWPPMRGIDLNQAAVEAYLKQFYRKARRNPYLVGGAFPGFHDIYQQAGVRASYGFLDAQEGDIFRLTLQMALEQNPDVIQLITWNDYGEGTIIEPTEEFGTRYLKLVQEAKRSLDPSGFSYRAEDLELPYDIYQRRLKQNDPTKAALDQAVEAILQGDLDTARRRLAGE